MAKFISKKLLVVILTGIINILVLTGILKSDITPLVIALIDGLTGLYITIQGIIDAIKK